jgi:hypothetical protein
MKSVSKISALRFDATASQQAFYNRVKGLAKSKHEQTSFIMRQLAFNTFGTIIEGSPALIGYFKNGGNSGDKGKLRYPVNHSAMSWLDTGINPLQYAVTDKLNVSNAILDLREFLLSLPLDIPEDDFLNQLEKAIAKINPLPTPKVAKPKASSNALADCLATVLRDFDNLTKEQLQSLKLKLETEAVTV